MMKILRTALCATLVLLAWTPAAPAADQEAFANGSGMIREPDRFRNFAFTARMSSDGSVRGQFQLKNRNLAGAGATISGRSHGVIDCLEVQGNVATLSGKIVRSSDPDLVGSEIWFRVEDNGEGAEAAPDRITLVSIFTNGGGPSCTQENPGSTGLQAISGGNIQIHD